MDITISLEKEEYERQHWVLYGLINSHYLKKYDQTTEKIKEIVIEQDESPFDEENMSIDDIENSLEQLKKEGLVENKNNNWVFINQGTI